MIKTGEIEIKLIRLERGTTRPILKDIEIIYPNKFKTDKRYLGVIDTGADITMIDSLLVNQLNLEELGNNLYRLEMRIKELFQDEILVFEVQPWNIHANNKLDSRPDLLLGRDFLLRCKMQYDGLNNIVTIVAYNID
jgi:hypothetical protein